MARTERRSNGTLHWRFLTVAAPVAVLALTALAVGADRLATGLMRDQALQALAAAQTAAAAATAEHLRQIDALVGAAALDAAVIEALDAFSTATRGLEEQARMDASEIAPLRQALLERLRRHYDGIGGDTPLDAARLLPSGRAPLLLQSQYVGVAAPSPTADSYAAAHARWHASLAELAARGGFSDLLLVRAADGQVLYDVAKTPIFQTSLVDGPYADSHLGALFRRLRTAMAGTVLRGDLAAYLPARGAPTGFAAAPVLADGSMIGMIVAAYTSDGLNRVVSAGSRWAELGLGASGQVVLLGADGTLRSAPRHAAEPARADAHGESEFRGRYLDARGVSRLAASAPLADGELGWRVVAEIDEAEALRPVAALRRQIGALTAALVVLVVVALAAAALWTTAPLRRLIDAVARLRATDASARLTAPEEGEIGALAAGVNALLEQGRTATAAERRRREAESRGVVTVLDAARAGDWTQRAYAGGELAGIAQALNELCEQVRERLAASAPRTSGAAEALRAAAEHLRSESARHLDALGAAEAAAQRGAAAGGLTARALDGVRRAGTAIEVERQTVRRLCDGLDVVQRDGAAAAAALAMLAGAADATAALQARVAELSTELTVTAINGALLEARGAGAEIGALAAESGRVAGAAATTADGIGDALAGLRIGAAAAADAQRRQAAGTGASTREAAGLERELSHAQETLAACAETLAALCASAATDGDGDWRAALAVGRDTARRLCHAADIVAREAVALCQVGAGAPESSLAIGSPLSPAASADEGFEARR